MISAHPYYESICDIYVKKICLFGGAGFVGSSIVRLLAKRGFELKIATRSPFDEDLLELKSTVSDPGQITIEKMEIRRSKSY